jgi:undecaprenyl diphosphate synthase
MSTIECIAFIMDGNRRWAKEQNLSTMEGHQKGFKKFKEVLKWLKESQIKNAIFYAFSTENWKRPENEISYLLKLFEEAFSSMEEVHKEKIRIRFLGQVERFPKKLQNLIEKMEADTIDYTEGQVGIALSYGGRADIVHAAEKLAAEGEKITEESLSKELWTANFPDPDIVVRTGEVMRLSNFLTWQSAYSELYFSATLWPDFDREEFDYILESYDADNRRRGK